MNKVFLILCLISVFKISIAQNTGAKSTFHYLISKQKLKQLNDAQIFITDNAGTKYQLCNTDKVFKCIINPKDGLLDIDAWSFTTTNAECNSSGIIGGNTPAKLSMTIPKRQKLTDPTLVVRIPYVSWVFSVNTLQLKVRPGVKDYLGNKWSSNVITGTYNLGLNIGRSFGWTNFTTRSTTNYSVTPGLNLGFGSASLSKEPLSKAIETKYSPSNAVISPAVSCVFARNDIGIILATGPDYMIGRDHGAWALQGKWTFGLGVNASFKL